MWIRSAFWVGTAKPGDEKHFSDQINSVFIPAFKAMPGVRDAKALWPRRLEDQPPQIACQFLVEFDSREEVDRMLASPERAALRPRVKELAAIFDGTVSHIDYEVGGEAPTKL